MEEIIEWSDWAFEICIINTLNVLMEKVDKIQEQIDVSLEVETLERIRN